MDLSSSMNQAMSEIDVKHKISFSFRTVAECEIRVVRFRGAAAINSIDGIKIKAAINAQPLSSSAINLPDIAELIDTSATLTIHHKTEGVRHINGIITDAKRSDGDQHWSYYAFRLQPVMARMQYGSDYRMYQLRTIQEILDKKFKQYGITQVIYNLKHEHPKREYCVQYGETDFDFVTRIMANEGMSYYFAHTENQHTLVVTDATELCAYASDHSGEDLCVPFNASRLVEEETHVWGFARQQKVTSGHTTLRDRYFHHPDYNQEYKAVIVKEKSTEVASTYERYGFHGGYKDERGKQYNQYWLDSLNNDAQVFQAKSNAIHFAEGHRFSLNNHPEEAYNRPFLVLSVKHQGEQPQSLEQSASPESETTYTAAIKAVEHRASIRMPQQRKIRVDGPQVATVVGPAGEEIFCDEYGRVKVQFTWDREGTSNEHSSCWIRVASHWAGAAWGQVSIPRIGQEVIVDFIDGDPDQPVITGRMYNARNRPPNKLPANMTKMSIKSKTHKGEGFNELSFEDEKDQEMLYMHAQKNMETKVLNSRHSRVDYDDSDSIGHDSMLDVANDRKETIERDQHINVKRDLKELIERDYAVTIKGDSISSVDGVTSINSKGEIAISSDTKITFRVGSNYVVLTPGPVDIKGFPVNINVGGSPAEAAIPPIPDVLKTAHGEGTIFVSHCPLKT